MAKASTLASIKDDIAHNRLGRAIDRLHGLLSTYPDDLLIRRDLARVYHVLQNQQMAGRYWYLEEEKTTEMQHACAVFEKACGSDPQALLRAIKFRGDIKKLDNAYAREKLQALQAACAEKLGYTVRFGSDNRYLQYDKIELLIIWIFILGLLGIMAVGLVTIVGWIF